MGAVSVLRMTPVPLVLEGRDHCWGGCCHCCGWVSWAWCGVLSKACASWQRAGWGRSFLLRGGVCWRCSGNCSVQSPRHESTVGMSLRVWGPDSVYSVGWCGQWSLVTHACCIVRLTLSDCQRSVRVCRVQLSLTESARLCSVGPVSLYDSENV